MKISAVAAPLLLISVWNPMLRSQSVDDRLARAAAFNDQGRFREAIDEVTPLLQHPQENRGGRLGIAWNIQGLGLQSVGERENARRSYEKAIEILRRAPEQAAQYASALDNFGSLEAELGEHSEARSLRLRARSLYTLLNDRAGVARVSNNLALVALDEGNRREARHLVAEAFQAETLVPKPAAGDLAALFCTQAIVQDRDGKDTDALDSINQAIHLWNEHYGLDYYLLGNGYSLRAQIEKRQHDSADAISDMRRALAVLQQSGQSNSTSYFLVEAAYARILSDAGMRAEATRMGSEAKSGLQVLRQRECSRCTTSADGFR